MAFYVDLIIYKFSHDCENEQTQEPIKAIRSQIWSLLIVTYNPCRFNRLANNISGKEVKEFEDKSL